MTDEAQDPQPSPSPGGPVWWELPEILETLAADLAKREPDVEPGAAETLTQKMVKAMRGAARRLAEIDPKVLSPQAQLVLDHCLQSGTGDTDIMELIRFSPIDGDLAKYEARSNWKAIEELIHKGLLSSHVVDRRVWLDENGLLVDPIAGQVVGDETRSLEHLETAVVPQLVIFPTDAARALWGPKS